MKDGPAEDAGESSRDHATPVQGQIRGIAIFDLMARFLAAAGTFGSAVAMGTTDESLTLFTQFQVRAKYNDLPALTFFVIANSIVSGYLVLSLPVSVFHIIRSRAKISRIILVIFDTVMLALLASGASAAAAIVYLAHKGNDNANWPAICQQVDSFCKRISGSLIGSFGATVLFILIVITSASALSRC